MVSIGLLVGGIFSRNASAAYALNHVQALRVMSSENTNLIGMLVVGLAMVGHALLYRPRLVRGLAFLRATPRSLSATPTFTAFPQASPYFHD